MLRSKFNIFAVLALCLVVLSCREKQPQSEAPQAAPQPAPLKAVAEVEAEAAKAQTPEAYLSPSLRYYQAGNYPGSITAANESLKRRPDYALAYNNIAAANATLGRWDEAIAAAQQAIKLQPDLQIAENNLAWALGGKQKAEAAKTK